MTDVAVPLAPHGYLEVIEGGLATQGMEPSELAELIHREGEVVQAPTMVWRDLGAQAMVLTAMNRDYVFEMSAANPPLVTRLDPPAKPIKNGPYTMLPIERCEAEPDEVIIIGQSVLLRGLCRVTKRIQPAGGYNTGPAQGLTILR